MWAAAKAAEVDCGSPAGRPARRLAAEEGGIPCCRPKQKTIKLDRNAMGRLSR